MTKRLALVGALMLWSFRADAHRLDEYLEQTLIELEPERVVLHVDLTPGVAVASRVIPSIDTDGDGALSAVEQSAYAEAVRRDLSLQINDVVLPLRVLEAIYPTIASMNAGTGTIVLTFEASLPSGLDAGTLRFANHHAAAVGVYMANCLMPRPPVRVLAQSRSHDQSSYQAELGLGATEARPATHWGPITIVAPMLAGTLLFWGAAWRYRGGRPS